MVRTTVNDFKSDEEEFEPDVPVAPPNCRTVLAHEGALYGVRGLQANFITDELTFVKDVKDLMGNDFRPGAPQPVVWKILGPGEEFSENLSQPEIVVEQPVTEKPSEPPPGTVVFRRRNRK